MNNIYVFIDAANLWQVQKAKGRFLNHEKIVRFLKGSFRGDQIKIFYYAAYPAQGTRTYSLDSKHRFFTYLKKGLGFAVRKKELKRITVAGLQGEIVQEKGNMDVEMAKVYVFSSRNNISQELRTGSDGYFDILKLNADIWGNQIKRRGYSSDKKTVLHEEDSPRM